MGNVFLSRRGLWVLLVLSVPYFSFAQAQNLRRIHYGTTSSTIFKPAPYVPGKGIENVLKDLASRRPVSKEFSNRPELFRDNEPLERALTKP